MIPRQAGTLGAHILSAGHQMPTRSNACSELVRFWLQSRHGHLIDKAFPFLFRSPCPISTLSPSTLEVNQSVCLTVPRLIVETKDEHDWEPLGKEFGAALRADVM